MSWKGLGGGKRKSGCLRQGTSIHNSGAPSLSRLLPGTECGPSTGLAPWIPKRVKQSRENSTERQDGPAVGRMVWYRIVPALPLPSLWILSQLYHLEPQFPHLQNADNNNCGGN